MICPLFLLALPEFPPAQVEKTRRYKERDEEERKAYEETLEPFSKEMTAQYEPENLRDADN